MSTRKRNENGLMHEELSATWMASALICSVIGANVATRAEITASTRLVVEVLFFILALFIAIWTFVSYFNLVSFEIHRLGLVIIFLAIIGAFAYLIAIAFKNKL